MTAQTVTKPSAAPAPSAGAQTPKRRRLVWSSMAKRVIRALLVIFLVTIASLSLLDLAPGSAADAMLGEDATPETVAALNAELGLDDPLWQRYGDWLGGAVQGDLGTSPISRVPVSEAIVDRLPVTLEIAVLALLMALVLSVILAVAAASLPGSLLDRGIAGITSVLLAVPAFVAGPILIYFLAVQSGYFPVSGWTQLGDGLGENLRGAFLPAFAVALTEIAVFTRLLQSDLVGTLREDYVAAARAKGMTRAYVMFRHALRPSSFSLITVAGISLGRLIGGTVVVETLFGLPGLGQLVSTAIFGRDIITVQGIVVFVAVVYVGANTLVDISYGLLDPRVRKAERG
ncbi:ABC transporter permease [Nocardioides sp. cx-169]|uniref:ABC transporter permease n=1 Tax=Nocardioides sp. cx-169 TaxID=2899080 RepID=UPI001E2A2DA9|nr:ABC transporter permease [Nocardioides sp. cx-169]MCD4533638.1 ABC transporter permease [Nocardioides sp. cx-169]